MEQVIYEFELKDGSLLQIEGEAGKEEEARKKAVEYQSSLEIQPIDTAQQELTGGEKALDILKTAGGRFYKGLSYIPGFVGDIEQLGQELLPEFLTRPIIPGAEPTQVFPTSETVRDVVGSVVPQLKAAEEYQPKTREAELIGGAIEFAAPGLAAKAKSARRLGTAIGGTSGLVYEGLRPYGEGLAAGTTIPLTLGLSLLARPSTASRLLEEPVKRLTPAQISEAKKIEEAAQRMGIKLTPGESLDSDEIRLMQQNVYKTQKGYPYLYDQFKDRPTAILREAEAKKKLIGEPIKSKRELLDSITKTSQQAVKKARDIRKSESQKAGYAVSNTESLDPTQVFTVINLIDKEIAGLGRKNPNIQKLKDLKEQLIKKRVKVKGQKKKVIVPETNINILDSVFKRNRGDYKNTSQGKITSTKDPRYVDSELGGKYFKPDGTGILDTLKANLNTNKYYKAGNKTYELLSKNVDYVVRNIDPLLGTTKKSVTSNKIKNFIFKTNDDNAADIKATYKILNETDPQAFIDIANIYFRNALNKVFPSSKINNIDLKSGHKLYKEIVPDGYQTDNFMAVLDGVADAKKLNAKQTRNLKLGFEKFFNVLERSGRLKNIAEPGVDVAQPAAQTVLKDFAMAKTFNPWVRLTSKYSEIKQSRALSDLGKIFASDDAIEELIRLAKTDPNSKAAVTKTLNIILSTEQVQRGLEDFSTEE